MSHKEINAWVMAASAVLISAWVVFGIASDGLAPTAQQAAISMVWAIGCTILFNVVAVVVSVVAVTIVQREELRDERADERDHLVTARAMRNAYFVLSSGVGVILVGLALGLEMVTLPYLLFGISMLAGGIFALSQAVYYRVS